MTTTVARPESGVLPERFAVEVTVDDIMHGEPSDADKCPLALAVTRWLRRRRIRFVAVTVTSRDVLISIGRPRSARQYWSIGRPRSAQHYWHDSASLILAFDHGEPVEPRTVVLAKLP